MSELEPLPTDPVPTQIAFPARTLLRTIVQFLISGFLAWLTRKFGLDLAGWSQQIVDFVTAVLWGLLMTLVTWVMTRPAVAKILAGTLLAPAPALTTGN